MSPFLGCQNLLNQTAALPQQRVPKYDNLVSLYYDPDQDYDHDPDHDYEEENGDDDEDLFWNSHLKIVGGRCNS